MTRIFLSLFMLILIGCGRTESRPPIIFSMSAEPDIVPPEGSSIVTVEAGDPDRDELSYLWTASGGKIEGSGKKVTWLSPKTEGKYELTVTVSDGADSVTQTLILKVWAERPGDYYPLSVGNSWVFQDDKGNTINFEIIGTINVGGTTVFVKQTTSSGLEGAVNFSYVSKSSDAVNQYAVGGASAGDDTIIFSPVLPLYRFPLIPGESWEVEFEAKVPDGYFVGNGKAIYRVLSEETITVSAGTFQHVFQVEEDFTWELLGQPIDHSISRQWLAPNVGIVKFALEQTRGGQTVITSATLQSYSIK